jgi:hypothetical protein
MQKKYGVTAIKASIFLAKRPSYCPSAPLFSIHAEVGTRLDLQHRIFGITTRVRGRTPQGNCAARQARTNKVLPFDSI